VDGSTRPDPGSKQHHWLGPGVYFWEESPSRALRWAEDSKKAGWIKQPAVIGAVINMGNCLNLIEAAHVQLVTAAYDVYSQVCKETSVTMAENKGSLLERRFLDHAVFKTLHEIREEQNQPAFDTIRACFIEGTAIYPTAGIRSLDHIQICVTNPKRILGFFHVHDPNASAFR
jgi:hypothetical protein